MPQNFLTVDTYLFKDTKTQKKEKVMADQNSVKGGWTATSLYMTQDSDTCVIMQPLNQHLCIQNIDVIIIIVSCFIKLFSFTTCQQHVKSIQYLRVGW